MIKWFHFSRRYAAGHKTGSLLLNIGGLSIGLASVMLIAYFLITENSMDKFHLHGKDIYRINMTMGHGNAGVTAFANTPPALSPHIVGLYPEVMHSARLRYAMQTSLTHGDKTFFENYGFYADSSIFKVFDFEFVQGDGETALKEPNTIVVTRSLAIKYFGSEDVIGETLVMNHTSSLKITGVLADVPVTSHLRFEFLISFDSYRVPDGYFSDLTSWTWVGFLTYIRLEPGSNPKELTRKLNSLISERLHSNMMSFSASLQPLFDIYFGSGDLSDDLNSHMRSGDQFVSNSLLAIAILILLIAAFNFTSLSMAMSLSRWKEVGIRKVLGISKFRLAFQLLYDSVILCIISWLLAFVIILIVREPVLKLLGIKLATANVGLYILFSFLAVAFFGLIVGIYPSVVLTNLKTTQALKGIMLNSGKSQNRKLQSALLAIQFGISTGLILSTIVVLKQLQYLNSQSLGFQKEHILVIKLPIDDMRNNFTDLKAGLERTSDVISVSASERMIGEPWPANGIRVADQPASESRSIVGSLVGYDYLKTMGIKLKVGRTFQRDKPTDSLNSIILNEAAVELLGLDNPIGEQVTYFSRNGPRIIIGVVEDFNFSTLRDHVRPMALILPHVDIEYMYIRLAPGDISKRLSSLRTTWGSITTDIPMDYRFLDDQLSGLYAKESQLSVLVTIFSGLAICLSLLGLFGLVSFTVSRRMKEIGIRKVFGASVASIISNLGRNYLFLIIVSSILSFPITYILLDNWLQDFAYRITIGVWIYLVTLITLLVAASAVVVFQAGRAALKNPVEVLRTE